MILGTLIEKMAGMKITFSDYPRNAASLLELQEQVNNGKQMVQSEDYHLFPVFLIINYAFSFLRYGACK